jgi:LmbE family N-acetylglucosaminyl deacetylase
MNPILKSVLRTFVRAARPHLEFTGLLQTSGVLAKSAAVWRPGQERVLVLAPHMDDETIGCGGTIALHARAGAAVTVVFLTDGRNGGGGLGSLSGKARERKQAELIDTRQREAEAALAVLGPSDMRFLGVHDGELAKSIEPAAATLKSILAEVQPELVYLPFFTDEHPDHRAASELLLSAAEGLQFNFMCIGYEVWTPLFPNCIVNIDETASVKQQALERYVSQLQDGDYVRAAMGLSAYRSIGLLAARDSYAEAFFMCPVATYQTLHGEFFGTKARVRGQVAQSAATAATRTA